MIVCSVGVCAHFENARISIVRLLVGEAAAAILKIYRCARSRCGIRSLGVKCLINEARYKRNT